MKAAVVHSFDHPLSLEDVPGPEPGAEQVRVEACDPCHTGIHAARGEWPPPRMVFCLAEVSTVGTQQSSLSATT